MAYTSRDEITQAIKEIAIGVDEGKICERFVKVFPSARRK